MKKLVLWIVFLLFLPALPAQAAVIDQISVNLDQQLVTISGQSPEGAARAKVSVQILNAGKKLTDFNPANPGEHFDVFIHIGETTTDRDGRYTYRFILEGESTTDTDKYLARVGVAGASAAEKRFDFTNRFGVGYAIGQINDVQSREDMPARLEAYKAALGLELEAYEALDGDGKAQVAYAVFAGGPYAGAEQLRAVFYRESLYQSAYAQGDAAGYHALILAHPDVFAVFLSGNTYANLLSDTQKNGVWEKVWAERKGLDTPGRIQESLDRYVFTAAVCGAGSKERAHAVFGEFPAYLTAGDALGLRYTSYSGFSLENQKIVCGYVLESRPAGLAGIQNAFQAAVDKRLGELSASGGGGGGGGGSAPKVVLPAPAPQSLQAAAPATVFTDIAGVPWAAEGIAWMEKQGIIHGDGGGSFRPDASVTRGEFVKMLVNSFRLLDGNAQSQFEDVPAASWQYPYVSSAKAKGIVMGISDSVFGVDSPVTRQDIAVLCWRAAGVSAAAGTGGFSDSHLIDDYAREAVSALADAGVLGGRGDGRFDPKAGATRAEAVKIIYGLIAKDGGEER